MLFNSISQYIKKYLLPYGSQIKLSRTEDVGNYSVENYVAPQAYPTIPTVRTTTPTGVGITSATLGGNVTSSGGAIVNEYGVVWKTSTGPTIADNRTAMGMGVNSFSRDITGLPSGTTIYVKAYAINSMGIAYGNEQTAVMAVSIISLNLTNANPSNASSVQFTAIFSASITGLSTSNFSITTTGTLSGASVTSVSGSGTTYTVTVNTGTGNGNLELYFANDTGLSKTISNVPFAGQTYLIDKTAPVATITAYPNSITNITTASFSFTGTDTGGGTVVGFLVSLDGTTYVSATSPKVYTGLSDGIRTFYVKAVDSAGNIGTPATYTWTVDTVAPYVVSSNRLTPTSSTVNSPSTLVYAVTFSESVTGVDVSDFTLTDTGGVAGSIASIAAVSDSVYNVTVNTITAGGTMRLDLKSSGTGIQDLAGNSIAGGYTVGQIYTITSYTVSVTNNLPNVTITALTGITGYTLAGSVALGTSTGGTHSALSSSTVSVTFTGTTVVSGNCSIFINGTSAGYQAIANGTSGGAINFTGISCSATDLVTVSFSI